MKKSLIQYTVKDEVAAENERLVAAVFAELRREQPEGIHYASFKAPDGVTFIHIISSDSPAQGALLSTFESFKSFLQGVHERCVVQPKTTELDEVGSYGFFGRQS